MLNLDRHVRQIVNVGKLCAIGRWRFWMIAHQRNNGAVMTGAKLPDMQIRDHITFPFDGRTDFFRQILASRNVIRQHTPGTPDEPKRPIGDDQRTNDTNSRIEPKPSIETCRYKSPDSEHGGQRISKHVDIGCSKVVVVNMIVVMIMIFMMRMIIAQKPRAKQINRKTNDGNRYCLGEN